MSAKIFLIGRTLDEERLYAEVMAAYDTHRALGTAATFDHASRALKLFRLVQEKISPEPRAIAGAPCCSVLPLETLS